MLRLRPYKPSDADTILGWIKDEDAFRKWSTDRYSHYPITADDMNYKYMDCNGDCAEPDNFYPMTAFDILKVRKVTLGVLENNPGAYHCYQAAGFQDAPMDEPEYYHLLRKNVECLELEMTRG